MQIAITIRRRLALLLGLACAALFISAAAAEAQRRIAFVVGNGDYRSVAKLPNALNDASATATVLREAGFDVVPATDATLGGMREALASFIGKVGQAGPGTTALVYYAGHAVQLDGSNYLLPVDVRPESSAGIPGQSLSLSDILRRLDATAAVAKIVILDACRNNPFVSQDLARGLSLHLVDGATEGARSEAGLARIESRSGTFVAFATSPGATAADGAGSNSPFTQALLRQIREPGLPVEQLFRRIRLDVHDATGGQQLPWDTSSLISDFSFFARGPATPPGTRAETPASLSVRPTAAALRAMPAADAYRAAIAWDRPDIYRGFLAAQPDDERALLVHRLVSQRTEEAAWAETVRAGDAESYRLFVRLFAGSQHAGEALRLAATAPPRQTRIAAVCPVCPAAPPQRARRASVSPRATAPSRPPVAPGPVRRTRPAAQGANIDQPAPAPVPVLPLVAGPRWAGLHIGGFLSAGRQDGGVQFGGLGPQNSVATSIQAGNVPANLSSSGERVLGGALVGFAIQAGSVVFGAETDFSAAHLGGRSAVSVNPFGVQVTTSARNELFTLGTVRARVGVAFGDLLIFGTGGYAYGRAGQSGSIVPNPSANPTYVGVNPGLIGGWAAGGGVEYAIGPRISLRLDYLHYDLGSQSFALGETTGLIAGEIATIRASTRGDVVRAGVNLTF